MSFRFRCADCGDELEVLREVPHVSSLPEVYPPTDIEIEPCKCVLTTTDIPEMLHLMAERIEVEL